VNEGQTGEEIEDRQTDRKADGQKDRQADRHEEAETEEIQDDEDGEGRNKPEETRTKEKQKKKTIRGRRDEGGGALWNAFSSFNRIINEIREFSGHYSCMSNNAKPVDAHACNTL